MVSIPFMYNLANDLHSSIPKLLGAGFALPPLRVGCVLTHRCNLQCAMCFVWKRGLKRLENDELTTDQWLQIFDQIPSYSIITFTGGEPLVRRDLPDLLMAACKKHRVHLVSNGTMFNPDLIDLCVDLAPKKLFGKGLLSIGISLEGPPEIHDQMVKVPGAYEKTTNSIQQIIKAKKAKGLKYPLVDLKIVICKETQGSLIKLYDLADSLGLDIISYQQCSTQESSYGISDASSEAMYKPPPEVEMIGRETIVTEMNNLKKRALTGKTVLRFNPDMSVEYFADRYQNAFPLKHFTCSVAWSIMHIGPNGMVYPCFSIPMGSLKQYTLRQIWNGKPYREFRQKLKRAGIFAGCVGCCVMKKKRF